MLRDRVNLNHPADPQIVASMRELARTTGVPMARHYDRAAAEYLARLSISTPTNVKTPGYDSRGNEVHPQAKMNGTRKL